MLREWMWLLLMPGLLSLGCSALQSSDNDDQNPRQNDGAFSGSAKGLFLSESLLTRAQERISEQTAPFYASYQTLKSRADGALNDTPDPFHMNNITDIRFGWCEGENSVDDTLKEATEKFLRESDKFRNLALTYALIGGEAYATKAVAWMLTWANQQSIVNLYDFNINFQNASFDGMTDDGYCGLRPWNLALDAMWQSYGLINAADTYLLLKRNGYTFAEADESKLLTWIMKLVEAVDSSFHAWTKWADLHPTSSSYVRYRSDNHLSWCLAGILAGAVALNDTALANYVFNGGSWTNSQGGAYANPSHIKDVIRRAIYADGTVFEEEIRCPAVGYSFFHLWPMTLVAQMAEVHFADLEDIWGFVGQSGAGIEQAFDHLTTFFVSGAAIPDNNCSPRETFSDFDWYGWSFENAVRRYGAKPSYLNAIAATQRNQMLAQSYGPIVLLLGEP